MSSPDLSKLPPEKLRQLNAELEELARRRDENRIGHFRPYPRQLEAIALGKNHRERLFLGGNQTGKTTIGAYEMACHLSGRYPEDWSGFRFSRPIRAWCLGVTAEATRDAAQRLLLGPINAPGTGMIPKDCIAEVRSGRGVADTVDVAIIEHVSGYRSQLGFKSFERGRQKLQGESIDFAWIDEECELDVYSEVLARISATKGLMLMTATPLLGLSSVVSRFISEESPDRACVTMTLEDAGHFSARERKRIEDAYPEFEREARTKGVPMLGSGRIYPVAESVIATPAFEIPAHWARICGLDFGIQNFAASWLAWDRDGDVVYVTDTYTSKETSPILDAAAIKAHGAWIPCAWPHDFLSHDKGTGETFAALYRAQGVNMLRERATFEDGSNSVEAGIADILDRMRTGRFKVFDHLGQFFAEFRAYHRKDGRVNKINDHVLDSVRYGVMCLRFARTGANSKRRRVGQATGVDYNVLDPYGNVERSRRDGRPRSAHNIDYSVLG